MRLKPYDEYKETEYDWLVNVPKHWESTSIRNLTTLSNKRCGQRTDLELLSVYREYGVIKKSSRDDNHNVESADLSNYKYVNKGYLVLNKMKVWQGSLGVSKHEGIVSPAYIVCELSDQVMDAYIHYLLRSAMFKTIYNRISYGVRVGQWDMRYDDFKNIKLYLPPLDEQDQIVKYLDSRIYKINKYIKAKKKQIALLKERKQAIINRAVTKGLNPDVKMKPSGIEWLGDIPEGWKKNKISRLFGMIGSGTTPASGNGEYYNGNIKWVNSGDLNDGVLFDTNKKVTNKAINDYSVLKVYPYNTLVIAMYGATIGKLSILETEACCNQACCCLGQLDDDLLLNYVFYVLLSCRNSLLEQGKGGGQPNISQDIIKKTWIPIPPTEEQTAICDSLNIETVKINEFILKIEKEIELMNECRTRLISDVVTGKVDVRNIEINAVVHEQLDEEFETDMEYEDGAEDGEAGAE